MGPSEAERSSVRAAREQPLFDHPDGQLRAGGQPQLAQHIADVPLGPSVIHGWRRYLESPDAARFYATHKARIDREIKLGLRRPPKDPNSRPWRRKNLVPPEPTEL